MTLPDLDIALSTLNTIDGVGSRNGLEQALAAKVTEMLAAMGRQPVVLAQALQRPDWNLHPAESDNRTRADVQQQIARALELLDPGNHNAAQVLIEAPAGASKLPAVVINITQFSVAQDLAVHSDFAHCEFVQDGARLHEDLLFAQFYRGSIEFSMWATAHADAVILEAIVRSAMLRFDDSLRDIGIREISGGEGSGYQVTDQVLGTISPVIPVITYTFTTELRATQRRPDVIRSYTMVMTNTV